MFRSLKIVICAGLALGIGVGCDQSDAQIFGTAIPPRARSTEPPKRVDSSKEAQDKKVEQDTVDRKTYIRLNQYEKSILEAKGTDRAGNGGYTNTKKKGIYICKKCNAALYTSESKFASHCGWPSFESQIEGAVAWQLDADGYRMEIVCQNCDGHLGHVFKDGPNPTGLRYCVNSVTSMRLILAGKALPPRIVLEGSKEAKEIAAKKAAAEKAKKEAKPSGTPEPGDAKREEESATST